MQEVCFVVGAEIFEDVLEGDVAARRCALWQVHIVECESRIWIIGASEQGPKRIYNCCLADVVRPNDDVESLAEMQRGVLEPAEVIDVQ